MAKEQDKSPLIKADLDTARRVGLYEVNRERALLGLGPTKRVPPGVIEKYLSQLPQEEIRETVSRLLDSAKKGGFAFQGRTFYAQAIPEIHQPVSSEETGDHTVLVVGGSTPRKAIVFHDKRPEGSEGYTGDCIVLSRLDSVGREYRVMNNRLAVNAAEELVSNVLV